MFVCVMCMCVCVLCALFRVIIERFSRFPHRNVILGRESTPEELEFLETPGSRF